MCKSEIITGGGKVWSARTRTYLLLAVPPVAYASFVWLTFRFFPGLMVTSVGISVFPE